MTDDTTPPADPVPAWLAALPAPAPEAYHVELLVPASLYAALQAHAEALRLPLEGAALDVLASSLSRDPADHPRAESMTAWVNDLLPQLAEARAERDALAAELERVRQQVRAAGLQLEGLAED